MTSRQLDEEAIFHIARQYRRTTRPRADYLEQVCGDNTALLARVQALLEVHEKEAGFPAVCRTRNRRQHWTPSPSPRPPEQKSAAIA